MSCLKFLDSEFCSRRGSPAHSSPASPPFVTSEITLLQHAAGFGRSANLGRGHAGQAKAGDATVEEWEWIGRHMNVNRSLFRLDSNSEGPKTTIGWKP